MNNLIIFIIILIIIIYINYYSKFNKKFEIIQLTSDKLNQDILHEKLPILLEDIISSPTDFMNVLLAYEYLFKKKLDYTKNKFSNKVNQNLAHHLVIYNSNTNNIPVYISHPKFANKFKLNKNNSYYYRISDYIVDNENDINDTQFVKINLKPKQLLILPSYWLFYLNENTQLYFLYGFFNILVSLSKICF
jgi:hypothetical protein|tara:strand:- start:497 stop:1069 length:573 start_codon:yes stop_codon:yes gene_type:complete